MKTFAMTVVAMVAICFIATLPCLFKGVAKHQPPKRRAVIQLEDPILKPKGSGIINRVEFEQSVSTWNPPYPKSQRVEIEPSQAAIGQNPISFRQQLISVDLVEVPMLFKIALEKATTVQEMVKLLAVALETSQKVDIPKLLAMTLEKATVADVPMLFSMALDKIDKIEDAAVFKMVIDKVEHSNVLAIFKIAVEKIDHAHVVESFGMVMEKIDRADVPKAFSIALSHAKPMDIPIMLKMALDGMDWKDVDVPRLMSVALDNVDASEIPSVFKTALEKAEGTDVPLMSCMALEKIDKSHAWNVVAIALEHVNETNCHIFMVETYLALVKLTVPSTSPQKIEETRQEWYDKCYAKSGSRMWWIIHLAKKKIKKGENVDGLKRLYEETFIKWLKENEDDEHHMEDETMWE